MKSSPITQRTHKYIKKPNSLIENYKTIKMQLTKQYI